MKNIEQLMAEADPVRTLSQTGSVRLLKRLAPDPAKDTGPIEMPTKPPSAKAEPIPSNAPLPHPELATPASSSPRPAFQPVAVPPAVEVKIAEPVSAQIPPPPITTDAPKPEETETSFILKPAIDPAESANNVPSAPSLMPLVSVFRRKAKMADVARIVLPPKRDETTPPPLPPESSPTVVPPAFPVAAMTARADKSTKENSEAAHASASPTTESPFLEKSMTETPPRGEPEAPKPDEFVLPATPESLSAPTPPAEEKPAAPVSDLSDPPKVDPEAHKAAPSTTVEPKVDPEAHRPPPQPAAPAPSESVPQEKREFHLANGERVAGTVLSETPEAVYIEHATLGVLTIPRAQIAKRLVEIILINGDRIVGDILAETADTLYVRHASLGMLTVPRAQRSTRVVEAILKDGDRILGEVLTETDAFTVIRSATLGTITVPHGKLAMLNRKIEQIELKSLPSPAPELKDTPAL
jgi:RNase P/RNase MRP subunit p29